MGRPLNKNKLAGIVAIYNNGTVVTGARIVKQKGSKKFLLSDGNVYTMTGASDGDINAGEMALHATLLDGSVTAVSKITSKKVTLKDGTTAGWISSVTQVVPPAGFVWVESYEYWITTIG
jgi:hypothetical protein